MLERLDESKVRVSGLIELEVDAPDCGKEPNALLGLVAGFVVGVRF